MGEPLRRQLRGASLGLIALCGCGAAPPSAVRCDPASAREVGRVQEDALDEISGIATSRRTAGALWVHNDSGGPILYAIDVRGALLGRFTLEGVSAFDWEDIAIERRQGAADRLWIGDTGDNAAREGHGGRDSVRVLRLDEPALANEPVDASIARFDRIVLRYPDRARDCEAIAIDPESGDLWLFAKENEGPSDVFVARAPIADGEERVLERVGSIDAGSMVTAADFGSRGLLIRTYAAILLWERGANETWTLALERPGSELARAPDPLAEAIAWTPEGDAFYAISEGVHARIDRYEWRCAR